uniref:DNA repair and recombination protein RAD54-like n=1 Tax=Bursaphelenchus xylophilus TaxID=6326 RepID=A0A1I7S501_BURXY
MKRSAAPTSRVNQPYKKPSILSNHNFQTQSQPANVNPVRPNTQKSQSQDDTVIRDTSIFEENVEGQKKRRYTVVYAKQSNRKHKRWEGDGVLEVHGSRMWLRSEESGRPIVASGSARDLYIVHGARFNIGSYELEVQEEIKEKECVDYLIFCPPTELQLLLYQNVLDMITLDHREMIDFLLRICNHPVLLLARLKQILESGIKCVGVSQILDSFPPTCTVSDCYIADSNKFKTLFEMIVSFDENDEKTIIASYSKSALDLIEAMLASSLFEVLRLDTASPSERADIIKKFNTPNLFDHPNQVLLMNQHTKTMGMDLSGATRLVLFDSDWNVNSDILAKSLVWRNGQAKKCHIYRLLMSGSIEEKMLQRQQRMAGLDLTDISASQFDDDELCEIFQFHPESFCETHSRIKCKCVKNGCKGQKCPTAEDSPASQTANSMMNLAMGETQIRRSLEPDSQIIMENRAEKPTNEFLDWRHFEITEETRPIITDLAGFSNETLESISFIMIKEPQETTEELTDLPLL